MPEPLQHRHTEISQNAGEAVPSEQAPTNEDAAGTRIVIIVVAMFLLMFVAALVGLILIARGHMRLR